MCERRFVCKPQIPAINRPSSMCTRVHARKHAYRWVRGWVCGKNMEMWTPYSSAAYIWSGITQEQTAPGISAENLCVWVGRVIEKNLISHDDYWQVWKSPYLSSWWKWISAARVWVRVCVCVRARTSFPMRCPSAYQPVGSLGTAHHFAAKQQTVTGFFFFSFLLSGFFTYVVYNRTRRWKETSLFVCWRKTADEYFLKKK